MSSEYEFPCSRCGLCCRNVFRADETRFLDRGDGVCRYLDDETNLCSIYEDRPEICRVELQYMKNYQQQMSWKEFCDLNTKCCEFLQSKF